MNSSIVSSPAPLIRYAALGLRRCYMPRGGLWSHKYHLDGREAPNESVPHSDGYYSLNVLLGFARNSEIMAGEPYDLKAIFKAATRSLQLPQARIYAFGMALWAGAELGFEVPGDVLAKIRGFTADSSAAIPWSAQDIGLMLSGAVAQSRFNPAWRKIATSLRDVILASYRAPGGLFFDSGSGLRRHFASFATQVYSSLGLYQYGEAMGDPLSIAAANECVTRLIALQGPRGEWPWFFVPGQGTVVDFYEVYSVHQHGMAPAILHHAIRHGVPGAREALVKGFLWLFGGNELGCSMLRPELNLIYRSQRRSGIGGSKAARVMRALANAALSRADVMGAARSAGRRLTLEMRSYELGWILWSFGGRRDFPELTDRTEFAAAL
ncbi:MAG TPA: hypothetical protein VKE72_01590 [Methylocella sp.]|nr:hypothetical protein [Methylocella sp.]